MADLQETLGTVLGIVGTAADAATSAYTTFYDTDDAEALVVVEEPPEWQTVALYGLAGAGLLGLLLQLFGRRGA